VTLPCPYLRVLATLLLVVAPAAQAADKPKKVKYIAPMASAAIL
jgi:hypothetical protein